MYLPPRSIFDFTNYVIDDQIGVAGSASTGILQYDANEPVATFDVISSNPSLAAPVSRFGDLMDVDDFAELAGVSSDPAVLVEVADRLTITVVENQIGKNRGAGVLVCGSPGEVDSDPYLDDFFDVKIEDLDW